jgi:hypothetical protein
MDMAFSWDQPITEADNKKMKRKYLIRQHYIIGRSKYKSLPALSNWDPAVEEIFIGDSSTHGTLFDGSGPHVNEGNFF